MRKAQTFFCLTFVALVLVGCRNESMYSENSTELQNETTFRQVNKKEIPFIMNFLASKTNDFKVPLKNNNALGKTETIFGEIDTNNIIESTNENNETYYVFSIIPDVVNANFKLYNLEIKSYDALVEPPKIVVYQPTTDWALNGNGNYAIFSGRAYTYSLDGNLETSVDYNRGTAGPCDPKPCPDCDPGPGNPPIGGNTGGGSGGGTGTGNPPTGTGGPVAYPPFIPAGGGSPITPGQTGNTSGGTTCYWTCIFDENNQCYKMECIEVKNTGRLVNPCGGGGVVIAPPKEEPCKKTAKMLNNPKTKPALVILKDQTNVNSEKGVKFKADGTPSAIIDGDDHTVDFGDKTGYQGGYHNHTPKGIPMFSPPDIDQLLSFARAQGNGNPTNASNAYLGMFAPNGMHYVIRFNGNYDGALVTFTQDDLKKYKNKYREQANDLTEPINSGTTYINSDGSINNKGVEKLFFETLKNMGLNGKVSLQRIETSGAVQSINLDSNNQPIAVPCS